LGLSEADVPELIRMALDQDLFIADSEDDAVWAPIHAWRALGQLGVAEAAEPLTQVLVWADDFYSEWIYEELPAAYASIGPAAVPVLAEFVTDTSRGKWSRSAAGLAIREMGLRHPEARDACVAALAAALETYDSNAPGLNGSLINNLVYLNAIEAAPWIERAFDANAVDLSIMGDWEEVQIALGLLEERQTPIPEGGWLGAGMPPEIYEVIDRLRGMMGIQQLDTQGHTGPHSPETAAAHLKQIGRNDPCWCGSGKKYKHCHLREDRGKVQA
jgi:hypothetical protein